MQKRDSATAPRLPFFTIVALGQLALPLATVYLPLNLFLAAFYTGDLGLNLRAVGLVLMVAHFGDFIVDPLIGSYADRFGRSLGRRRLWTAIAVPITMGGVYLTFLPPAGAGPLYLLGAVMLVYFGWTMATIAYGAWCAEASDDYKERTRITGVREMFGFVGILVASLAIPYSGSGPGMPNGYATLMSTLAWIVLVLLPLSAIVLVCLVPEPKTVASTTISWRRGLHVATRNGPFMLLLATNFIGRIGTAANVLTATWFFDKGLDLGKAASIPILVYFVTAVAGAPIWIWAGRAIAKHNALIVASLGGIAIFSVLFFIPQHQLMLTTAILAAAGIFGSAASSLGASIAADVIDLDTLRSGEARAGLLLSFWGMAQKGADALGAGIGLWILSTFGFHSTGPSGPHGLLGLKVVYIVVPIMFWLMSIVFIWRFPITPDRQRRIRDMLERRARRKAERSA